MIFDAKELDWKLSGWMPFGWRLARSMENLCLILPEIASVPARVPGSVQQSLRDAGLLPDWNVGVNARACEWVENRDWQYSAELPEALIREDLELCCLGLDGAGEIWVNKTAVLTFDNAFVPYTVKIGHLLKKGQANRLDIFFLTPPRALGQINRTSRIRRRKPRFNYGWDWCCRLVQIGIWDRIFFRSAVEGVADGLFVRSRAEGVVEIAGELPADFAGSLSVSVTRGGRSAVSAKIGAEEYRASGLSLTVPDPEPWNINGRGERAVYRVECLLEQGGAEIARRCWSTGFADFRWEKNPGAPEKADPWLLRVNGEAVFIQGVNWTPIRTNFADVPPEEMRKRLEIYADMGCNLLRVWGGAVLEKEEFYDICDELGLMVIQEFPLSSSGVDNYPPEDGETVRAFGEVASSYIRRRASHPCLLAWCGGNELQWGMDDPREGVGIPVGLEHPMLANFARICGELDPERRFLPACPSGPRGFGGEEFGEGVHWDVHGPWHLVDGSLEGQRRFYENDDALMRSEIGVPGASAPELLRQYGGGLNPEPYAKENPFWLRSYWYDQFALFRERKGHDPLSPEEYAEWSQRLQAEGLAVAVRAAKGRFPRCGGIILWMGHDAYPCPVNLSLIQFDGSCKPAVEALKTVFRQETPEVGKA